MSRQGRDTDTQKGRVTSEQEKSGASSKGSAPGVSMMSSSKQESKPITLKLKLFNPGGTPDDEGERKAVTKRRRSQAASGDESPSTASASHASSHTQQGLTPTTPKSSASAPGAGPSPSAGNTTPNVARHGMPLSERQQMALLMQLTASEQSSGGDASPHTATSPPPSSSLAGGSSSVGKKTPLDRKVNKRNERGETMLHMAAKRGDVKHTRKLIKAGADVNVRDYAGWTPLHEACNHGSSAVARLLLRAGANVNVQGLDNDTPLHDAAGNGHEKIVEVLMRHGANPNQPNSKGKSPLDIAANETILRILRQEVTLVGSSSAGSCTSSDEQKII